MRMTPEAVRPVVLSISTLAALVLSACGESRSATATQVAVKVNKDEITTLQVNEQLARLPNGITPDQQEPATRKVLSGLVNQQLLVQQAVERKLDRDPQVLGALEAARLNILAQAYVQRVIVPQAKPTEQEVRKYYADNPALFSERKIYRLQELSIEANAEQEKQIELAAARAKSLKELADYLRQKKIAFSADSGVRTAEQLPLARLPQIAQLKTGNVLVFSTGSNRASALEVLASESQPVDDKKATPVIEQYLSNRKRDELASLEVKRLRDAAKIQYIGDFAKFAGEPAGNTTTVAAEKPVPSDQDKGIAALR